MMWSNSTFEFWTFWIFGSFWTFWISLVPSCYKFPCADDWSLLSIQNFRSLSVATSLPVLMNSWASLAHPWELDAASGLEFWFVLASSLSENSTCRLEALSVPCLLDASGLFTEEELVGKDLTRVIADCLDFAAILFSSFCSCILLAILSVQLIKLKFSAQQRELKWLMLNNEEDCSIRHGWSVLLSTCQQSGVWCQCTRFESQGPS